MRNKEQWSKYIDRKARFYKKCWLTRFLLLVQYRIRVLFNNPITFQRISDTGEPVGETVEVEHLALHDMFEHRACWVLTHKLFHEGLRANAYERIKIVKPCDLHAISTIQPRWV